MKTFYFSLFIGLVFLKPLQQLRKCGGSSSFCIIAVSAGPLSLDDHFLRVEGCQSGKNFNQGKRVGRCVLRANFWHLQWA